MTGKQPFRPWGELKWTLGLSAPRRWRFFGCAGAEERSVKALIELHGMGVLDSLEMLRILDTVPEDSAAEKSKIEERLTQCAAAGCPLQPSVVPLDASLQNSDWKERFTFFDETSFCLDVSSLPKRFFFPAIKAALKSPRVRDFVVVYSKPNNYPDSPLSGDPEKWSSISGFMCDDPDVESKAASRLIVGSGFVVDGLREHLAGRGGGIHVDVLIPFPAEPWKSVRRSWESAKEIEEGLMADPKNGLSEIRPTYHRVGALDTSTAFETLLSLTNKGENPAALAPLGPKPISVAMCLLASQSDRHPVYYAQPKTYAVNYSSGCERIYAYWIKHDGVNLYAR